MSASEAGATAPLDLEAIRGRGEAALVTLNDEGRYRTLLWWACIEDDIPALIAEVERLRAALSGHAASEPVAWRVTERWLDGTIHYHLFHAQPTPWEGCIDIRPLGIIGAPGDSEEEAAIEAGEASAACSWLQAEMASNEGSSVEMPYQIAAGLLSALRLRAAGVGAPEGPASGCDPDRCEWWRRFNSGYYAEPVAPADGREGENGAMIGCAKTPCICGFCEASRG